MGDEAAARTGVGAGQRRRVLAADVTVTARWKAAEAVAMPRVAGDVERRGPTARRRWRTRDRAGPGHHWSPDAGRHDREQRRAGKAHVAVGGHRVDHRRTQAGGPARATPPSVPRYSTTTPPAERPPTKTTIRPGRYSVTRPRQRRHAGPVVTAGEGDDQAWRSAAVRGVTIDDSPQRRNGTLTAQQVTRKLTRPQSVSGACARLLRADLRGKGQEEVHARAAAACAEGARVESNRLAKTPGERASMVVEATASAYGRGESSTCAECGLNCADCWLWAHFNANSGKSTD